MDISVIIVTLGRRALLTACLDALDGAVADLDGRAEVVVVLNASDDGDDGLGELLAARARSVTLVALGFNTGFAGGVNAGVARSTGRWIALVNDDAEVDPGFLTRLLAVGEADPSLGSVAGQLRFHRRPSVINSAGIAVDRLGVATDRGLGQPVGACGVDVHEVFGACGGAALYRRSMYEGLHGLDERFFAYLEDVDLAWRARAAGWRCVHVPTAFALHHHSASSRHGSSFKHELVGRNRMRLLAKNASRRQLLRHGPAIVAYDIAFVAFSAVRERTLAPLRGRWAGLREWRSFRRQDGPRLPLEQLASPLGVRAALRRRRAWRVGATRPAGPG